MIPDPAQFRPWLEVGNPALRILLIWGLAWVVLQFLRRLLRVFRTRVASRMKAHLDLRRVETLTNVFRYAANVVIAGLAGMLTLSEFGISIAPILATAGVAGIAIGFGAQSLVKDFFTGLFLLMEDQVSEGDIIEAAGKSGYVERVTLRHIRMRDYDGSVHFIPNGMITSVTNRSRGYAFAVIDINVPRHLDADQVFALIRRIAEEMRKDPACETAIVDDVDIAGVEKLEDATFGIRCRIKVVPARQAQVRAEFLRRMKQALDALKESQSPPGPA
ncbi:MAG: moderate conductance mechanosensitive channel [Burkholderiales bacterium]|jgi:small conductance mechanosensitive channel